MDGIILINKQKGITSFKTVDFIKKKFNLEKIGHSGTLDPMATGLLIGMINKATKINEYLDYDKEYEIEITFGKETDTCDAEGRVVRQAPVPDNLMEKIKNIIPSFTGEIMQKPPAFSALKKDGEKSYILARKGIAVELIPRSVRINKITPTDFQTDKVKLVISCAGGTYMRSVARDMGEALGSAAFLSSINRAKIGKFTVNDSYTIDSLDTLDNRIISINDALYEIAAVDLNELEYKKVLNGVAIENSSALKSGNIKMVYNNYVAAIGTIDGNKIKIRRGI